VSKRLTPYSWCKSYPLTYVDFSVLLRLWGYIQRNHLSLYDTKSHRHLLLRGWRYPDIGSTASLNVGMPHQGRMNFSQWRVRPESEHPVVQIPKKLLWGQLLVCLERLGAGIRETNAHKPHTVQYLAPVIREGILRSRNCHREMISGKAQGFFREVDSGFHGEKFCCERIVFTHLLAQFPKQSPQKSRGFVRCLKCLLLLWCVWFRRLFVHGILRVCRFRHGSSSWKVSIKCFRGSRLNTNSVPQSVTTAH